MAEKLRGCREKFLQKNDKNINVSLPLLEKMKVSSLKGPVSRTGTHPGFSKLFFTETESEALQITTFKKISNIQT